jgi:hypothetical protein
MNLSVENIINFKVDFSHLSLGKVIGQGGEGIVYSGVLYDYQKVAIKETLYFNVYFYIFNYT